MTRTKESIGLAEVIDMARREVDAWPAWMKYAAGIDEPARSATEHPNGAAGQQADDPSPQDAGSR